MNRIFCAATGLFVLLANFRITLKFRQKLGHWPRFMFPRTYNEKMLWRKLFDRNPVIGQLTDKLRAKSYFKSVIPDLNVVEPLWIGTQAADIPDALWRQDVIIKTNHGCAYNLVVRDRTEDRAAMVAKVNGWLAKPYGQRSREWGYSQVVPKVYVEPMLRPKTDQPPFEFNFEVFRGQIIATYVIGNKASGKPQAGIFDENGNRLPVTVGAVTAPDAYLPPDTVLPPVYRVAAGHARRLGRDFDNVRVDFMCIDNEIYGCEMTFYCLSGRGNVFSDPVLYKRISDAWDMRRTWFLTTPQTGWRARYAKALERTL